MEIIPSIDTRIGTATSVEHCKTKVDEMKTCLKMRNIQYSWYFSQVEVNGPCRFLKSMYLRTPSGKVIRV